MPNNRSLLSRIVGSLVFSSFVFSSLVQGSLSLGSFTLTAVTLLSPFASATTSTAGIETQVTENDLNEALWKARQRGELPPHVLQQMERERQAAEIRTRAAIPQGQRALIDAQERRRGLHFVEVHDVEVVRILPDDNHGRKHQKWEVSLANGKRLLAVFNTSMTDRVPLEVGDIVSMGGEYIYDRKGGLLHWLHADPRNRRPDGYVELNGKRFGQDVVVH
jgi:hypothetical protein